MTARDHILLGSAASLALYPFIGLKSILFWIASIGIDFDHYLDYIYHNGFKDFSLKKMFDYHRILQGMWGRPDFLNLSVLHTIEFLLPMILLALWMEWVWLQVIFFGFVFHIILDMIFLYKHKIFFLRSYSVIEYYIRRNRLLKAGMHPRNVYDDALRLMEEGRTS